MHLRCHTSRPKPGPGADRLADAIDANLFKDGSTYRLNFGSFWGDIYQIPMAATPTKPSGTSVGLAYDPSASHAEEGLNVRPCSCVVVVDTYRRQLHGKVRQLLLSFLLARYAKSPS